MPLGAQGRAEQLQAEDVVGACGTSVNQRSTAALLAMSQGTSHGAGCLVSLSYCHLIVLLCSSHRAFLSPAMSHLYKRLISLQSLCAQEAGGEASRGCFPRWPWPLSHQPCLTLHLDLVAADNKP